MIKTGKVTIVHTSITGVKTLTVKLNDGTYTCFFSNLKGYNKSLKINDHVKVYFKNSMFGMLSVRVTKLNK